MRMTTFVSCADCPQRTSSSFCKLSDEVQQRLQASGHVMVYPAESVLFGEGEPVRGVYILCTGRVKMTANSPNGRTIVARVAKAGEALGVGAAVSGLRHGLTAETMEPSQACFIRRDDFARLLTEFDTVASSALAQLSREIQDSTEMIRSLGLSESAGAKLARLLVEWSRERGKATDEGIRLTQLASHEAIAQMIGASRETVTRHLGAFKRRRIIEINASTLLIRDPSALSIQASA